MIAPAIRFNGQVTFYCTRPNLKAMIAADLLEAAVPESATFPPKGDANILFENLSQFLGRTSSIDFQLIDPPDPDLVALKAFWDTASAPDKDYRVIWEQFILLNLDTHNVWLGAINDTIPDDLKAPPDLQPEAPTDEALEATDPNASERATE